MICNPPSRRLHYKFVLQCTTRKRKCNEGDAHEETNDKEIDEGGNAMSLQRNLHNNTSKSTVSTDIYIYIFACVRTALNSKQKNMR